MWRTPFSEGLATIVLLVGLALLAITGWWWPGILLVAAAASATEFGARAWR